MHKVQYIQCQLFVIHEVCTNIVILFKKNSGRLINASVGGLDNDGKTNLQNIYPRMQ